MIKLKVSAAHDYMMFTESVISYKHLYLQSLVKVAVEVCKALKNRVNIPPLINTMHEAFQNVHSWYNSTSPRELLVDKIQLILSELQSKRAGYFKENLDNIV